MSPAMMATQIKVAFHVIADTVAGCVAYAFFSRWVVGTSSDAALNSKPCQWAEIPSANHRQSPINASGTRHFEHPGPSGVLRGCASVTDHENHRAMPTGGMLNAGATFLVGEHRDVHPAHLAAISRIARCDIQQSFDWMGPPVDIVVTYNTDDAGNSAGVPTSSDQLSLDLS